LYSVILVFFSFAFCALPAKAKYGGGSGDPNDPFIITSAEDLNDIGNHPDDFDRHFLLVNDIDLSSYTGAQFNTIGQYISWNNPDNKPFTGVFDGNGHTIRNFTYNSLFLRATGLFGYVSDPNAVIKNLTLVVPNISGAGPHTGCVVGFLDRGVVRGCKVVNGRIRGIDFVGGLVGTSCASISNCSFTGVVIGEDFVGGLIGGLIRGNSRDHRGYTSGCFSQGAVTGNRYVGGLIGGPEASKYRGHYISDCYSQCTVTGTSVVGGLCGFNPGLIYYSYAAGPVVGNSKTGGLAGYVGYYHDNSRTQHSYWDLETTGQSNSAGGNPKTTAEMQDARTFAGWGCFGTWTIDDGSDYPRLAWENAPGEIITKPTYAGGSGTLNEPYLIYTADQLNTIGFVDCDLDKHFRLMNDIDLSDCSASQYNPIGTKIVPFSGVFDGNGYTISNLVLNSDQASLFVGLFGFVKGAEAKIRNVHFVNVDINTPHDPDVGSLVGYLEGGTVINCSVRGGLIRGCYHVGGLIGSNAGLVVDCHADCNVTSVGYACGVLVGNNRGRILKSCANGTASSTDDTVGGLVGINGGKVLECFAWASVSGDYWVGGLAGRNYQGMIAECFALSSVYGNISVGGLVGLNDCGVVLDSYSVGPVSGNTTVGGLAGSNGWGAKIYNCYSAGVVLGNSSAGGLVGRTSSEYTAIEGSFWDIESSGKISSAGGTGLTTAEMQDVNTFIAAGWDFVGEFNNGPSDMWAENPAGGYPILWWQLEPLPPLPTFSGGAGTNGNPYIIANATDLSRIGYNPRLMDSHFSLINDVNLIDVSFFSIGSFIHPFTGKFDGNGNTIDHLDINRPEEEYIGFFRYVNKPDAEISCLNFRKCNVTGEQCVGALAGFVNGTVRDCSVEDCNISGQYKTGGLIGVLYGQIEHCVAIGRISSSGSYRESVGGLVGESRGEVSNCNSCVTVSGGGYVGGLVGYNQMYGKINNSSSIATSYGTEAVGGLAGLNAGWISRCYSEGEVYGDKAVGGLVGWSLCSSVPEAMILECYSNANVGAKKYGAGGLVGNNVESIYNCYSTGAVEGNVNAGGLAGNNGGDVRYCYSTGEVFGAGKTVGGLIGARWYDVAVGSSFWDTETSGQSTSAGGTGLVTDQMQTSSTFVGTGWDFVGETANGSNDIWFIIEGKDYPRLRWENNIPVAIAGPNQTAYAWIDGIADVNLDGSGSYDDDGDPLTYLWSYNRACGKRWY